VNSNPETVSTDYDISDRLYFEPLTLEDVLEILHREKPRGVIVQLGGQTPLNLAKGLEDAGVHSGDSACVLPTYRLGETELGRIRELTRAFALELGVVGLLNIQYAIRDGKVYVLEVNPRASRTVPFVSKATGVPLARLAARVMMGERLAELNVPEEPRVPGVAVKEAVFPFNRFDVDILLGPEMRSTGEVMGFDDTLGMAYAKAQAGALNVLPRDGGTLVVTVNNQDKPTVTHLLRRFHAMGFRILATRGTHAHLTGEGVPSDPIFKVGEGRPNIVDAIMSDGVQLLINTPLGKKSQYDDYAMRRAAITYRVPYLTTMSATSAACDAIEALRSERLAVSSLQERVGAYAPAPPAGVAGR
jgi:carbamoyl-phosphate synthase large subunit